MKYYHILHGPFLLVYRDGALFGAQVMVLQLQLLPWNFQSSAMLLLS